VIFSITIYQTLNKNYLEKASFLKHLKNQLKWVVVVHAVVVEDVVVVVAHHLDLTCQ